MVGSMTLAGGATAKPLEHTDFHEESTEIFDDFCDVPGLTVQRDQVVDGRVLVNPHGPDGLAYFHGNVKVNSVYTNVANSNFVTEVGHFVDKDLRVTDNGDGTLTILVLQTGPFAAFGPDGKAIARDPGQIRFEFLVDDGGTPADPSDDEFLAFLGQVKGSTGRTDDFCAAVVPVLED